MQLQVVSRQRGFLPSCDPSTKLNTYFGLWEELAKELPKLLVSDRLRAFLDQMPVLDVDRLDQNEGERAMLLLSFLGHAYVWCDSPPADHVPPGIAIPWYHVAQRLGRPPVLSYASYALSNWKGLPKMSRSLWATSPYCKISWEAKMKNGLSWFMWTSKPRLGRPLLYPWMPKTRSIDRTLQR